MQGLWGLEKNAETGVCWFREAARAGNDKAMLQYAQVSVIFCAFEHENESICWCVDGDSVRVYACACVCSFACIGRRRLPAETMARPVCECMWLSVLFHVFLCSQMLSTLVGLLFFFGVDRVLLRIHLVQ